jgi:cysteine sulfinate desulfinase/cysteine desulfurase-like protein
MWLTFCLIHRAHLSTPSMKVPLEWAVGTLRLSVGRHSTRQDVDRAVELVAEAAKKQLEAAPASRIAGC